MRPAMLAAFALILAMSAFAVSAAFVPPALSRCEGATPCQACRNCKACMYCNGGGGTCGTCAKPAAR